MTDDHDRLQETLDAILQEARATNGRVSALEIRAKRVDKLLYGDQMTGREGLVQAASASEEMLRQWRTLMTWGKRLSATFVGAIVVGLVNLAQQAI